MDADLDFEELDRSALLSTPIFQVVGSRRRGPDGRDSRFILIDAPRWANVLAVVNHEGRDCFVLVRQFRHGLGRSLLEFPGGMVEPGEDEAEAAAREFEEETGWKPTRVTLLGRTNPNPAFMTNTVASYRAEGLVAGERSLDEHEHIRVELVPVEEVRKNMGRGGEYDHGIMLMALWYFDNAPQ